MCNVFSGLIVTKKGKDWGKVLFLSGVHHEKDREKVKKKYGDNILAWESITPYSLDKFKFTHELNILAKEQKELMSLVNKWAKKRDKEKLLRSMITVTKDNKPTEDYKIMDNMIKIGDSMSLVCDFSVNVEAGRGSTQKAGEVSTQTAGRYSTQTAESNSTQTAGDDSTQTAGEDSTQRAGRYSTQRAGGDSTQTAGGDSNCIIYGDTSFIVLDGKNVLLTQIFYEGNKYIRKNLELDTLFKKYKKGDKIKVVKGEAVEKVKINKPNK